MLIHAFRSLRPEQWTKNFIIFAGLLFARELFNPVALGRTATAFVAFCFLSGVVYIFNDIMDREADRLHPVKSARPIASGALSPGLAGGIAAGLAVVALGMSFWLSRPFGAVAVGYLALQALYSGPLKHLVILDVLTIAIGFVMRAAAGALAIPVPISNWLLVVTILLALFLGLSKRRHELVLLADGATSHRPILGEYSPYLLDQMISVVTASTLVAYIFYCISPETSQKFGTDLLGLTIPFPLYGIFRYLYLVHRREGGGSPSQMLINDRPLLVCVALWALAVVVIVYRPLGV
ncbi:MAG: decaprenyl-phosphate phosphoribosyltransferase [Acidobacteriota bacterium]